MRSLPRSRRRRRKRLPNKRSRSGNYSRGSARACGSTAASLSEVASTAWRVARLRSHAVDAPLACLRRAARTPSTRVARGMPARRFEPPAGTATARWNVATSSCSRCVQGRCGNTCVPRAAAVARADSHPSGARAAGHARRWGRRRASMLTLRGNPFDSCPFVRGTSSAGFRVRLRAVQHRALHRRGRGPAAAALGVRYDAAHGRRRARPAPGGGAAAAFRSTEGGAAPARSLRLRSSTASSSGPAASRPGIARPSAP